MIFASICCNALVNFSSVTLRLRLLTAFQLLFYDQRGTGLSDGRLDLKTISIDQFVEDLEALRVAFGFEKISLMGHSWGAVIALFYAFKYQAHLNKLILVDARPVTNTFAVEQGQTVQQRFQRLGPQAQQTLNTTCKRPSAELSSEARAECIKLAAALNFYIIKESGHFPFVEQPEMLFAAIRAFMRA